MAAKRTTKKKTTKKTTRKKAAPKKAKAEAPPPTEAATSTALVHQGGLDLAARDEAISAFIHSVNEDDALYVVRASQAPNPYFLRRPTGIIELDIDLGGGFPAGGCCFISGPDNSGKTFLMLRTMAWQQKLFGNSCRMAYALTEGAFPYKQAIDAGLQVYVPDEVIAQWNEWRHLRGMPLFTPEEVAWYQRPEVDQQLSIIRGPTGESVLMTLLEAVRTNAFSVIACDSLNGLQPAVDAEKPMTKAEKVAAQATMIGRFFKQYAPITTGFNGTNHTTVLFTQQVRANQERANAPSYMQKFIPEYLSSGGGYAGKHYKLIGLGLQDGKLIKKGDPKVTIGKMISWFIEKGKAGTHDNKRGDVGFHYNLVGGVDEIGELIASGIKRSVIQTQNKKTVVVRQDDNLVLDAFTAPNQKTFRKMLEVDFDLELSLRREILNQAKTPCLYR